VSRQIPKSWDEALAHPTLRSLALRSSRRYVLSYNVLGRAKLHATFTDSVCKNLTRH
jgi:hypothetical protein